MSGMSGMRDRTDLTTSTDRNVNRSQAGGLVALVREHVIADRHGDVAAVVGARVDELRPLLSERARSILTRQTIDDLVGLGPLEVLLRDVDVTEVMVNNGTDIWVDRSGQPIRAGQLEPGQLEAIIERIISPLGLRLDRTSPIVDARLQDGSRVCAVRAPLAVDGTCLSIRRFRARPVALTDFAPKAVVDVIRCLIRDRWNVVVSGATSAGKTTLLNAMAAEIDPQTRIVTIEDTAELRLDARHVVRLEARQATADGLGEIGIAELLRTALRLRPDRLVVGEVRGAEAVSLVGAMNTGHDGSLATVHANGPADAVRRIESMVLQGATNWPLSAIREQVHSAIDAIVHVERIGNVRRVTAVAELLADPVDPRRVTLLADRHAAIDAPTRRRAA